MPLPWQELNTFHTHNMKFDVILLCEDFYKPDYGEELIQKAKHTDAKGFQTYWDSWREMRNFSGVIVRQYEFKDGVTTLLLEYKWEKFKQLPRCLNPDEETDAKNIPIPTAPKPHIVQTATGWYQPPPWTTA